MINLKKTSQLICNTNHLTGFFMVGACNSLLLLFSLLLNRPCEVIYSLCSTYKYSEAQLIMQIYFKKKFVIDCKFLSCHVHVLERIYTL